jgi:hypothetical protein
MRLNAEQTDVMQAERLLKQSDHPEPLYVARTLVVCAGMSLASLVQRHGRGRLTHAAWRQPTRVMKLPLRVLGRLARSPLVHSECTRASENHNRSVIKACTIWLLTQQRQDEMAQIRAFVRAQCM